MEIARPTLTEALGSEYEADEEIRRFLNYLRRPDTLTYSNVFTVTHKTVSMFATFGFIQLYLHEYATLKITLMLKSSLAPWLPIHCCFIGNERVLVE